MAAMDQLDVDHNGVQHRVRMCLQPVLNHLMSPTECLLVNNQIRFQCDQKTAVANIRYQLARFFY